MAVTKCFTCGKGFTGSTHESLMLFKKIYEELGVDRFFYKLHEKDSIKVVKKQDFNRIFKDQIQPNFENGAEYSHISEYNPQT